MKKNSTKRTLIMSLLSMVLCMSMLIGTTFAWFTDSVTSTNNVIKSGTLDVTLEYKDKLEDTYQDASQGAIFNYQLWEPGFVQVKHVKIANVGTLALKFQLNIIPNMQPVAGEANLADVIDVYMVEGATKIDRATLAASTPVGTLSSLMADADGAAYGNLSADTSKEYTIALKMQESAGNEYQDLSVGDGFSVQLLATQYTEEEDAFDDRYDKDASYLSTPVAKVSRMTLNAPVPATAGMGGAEISGGLELDAAFKFETTETRAQAEAGEYRYWHADFVVSSNKDVADNSIALAGYYEAYCKDYNDDNWVALINEGMPVAANQEVRLLEFMLNGGSMSYQELCEWVPVFECGLTDLDGSNAGSTITVELRLYEVLEDTAAVADETGHYITVGTYTHTF